MAMICVSLVTSDVLTASGSTSASRRSNSTNLMGWVVVVSVFMRWHSNQGSS